MKKIIIKSLIITTIINAVGCLTNFLCAKLGDFLLIRASLTGGEYQGYIGFGILLEHIYPLTNGIYSKITYLSFDILNFLTYYVLIFVVVFLIILYITKRKSKKKKKH